MRPRAGSRPGAAETDTAGGPRSVLGAGRRETARGGLGSLVGAGACHKPACWFLNVACITFSSWPGPVHVPPCPRRGGHDPRAGAQDSMAARPCPVGPGTCGAAGRQAPEAGLPGSTGPCMQPVGGPGRLRGTEGCGVPLPPLALPHRASGFFFLALVPVGRVQAPPPLPLGPGLMPWGSQMPKIWVELAEGAVLCTCLLLGPWPAGSGPEQESRPSLGLLGPGKVDNCDFLSFHSMH